MGICTKWVSMSKQERVNGEWMWTIVVPINSRRDNVRAVRCVYVKSTGLLCHIDVQVKNIGAQLSLKIQLKKRRGSSRGGRNTQLSYLSESTDTRAAKPGLKMV